MMEKRLKTIYKNVSLPLRIIFSIGLLSYLFFKFDFNLLSKILVEANFPMLIFCFILISLGIFISSYKWKILLRNLKEDVQLKGLFSLYYQGIFFNNFLPSNIGGDGYKFLKLSRKINSRKKAFISVFLDRISGVFVLGILFIISLIFLTYRFYYPIRNLFFVHEILILGIISLMALFILLFLILVKKSNFIRSNLSYLGLLNFKVFILSFLFYLVTIMNNYFISKVYGLSISPIYYFIFMPIILLLLFLPISFNGVGIREISFIFLFGLIGVSKEQAFLLGFTPYILLVINSFIGLVIYLVNRD